MYGASNIQSFHVPGHKVASCNVDGVDVTSDDDEMPDRAASPEWTGLEFSAASESDSDADDVNDIPRKLILARESNRK